MSEERLPCGHTEAEHEEKVALVAQAVGTGNFLPLIAYLDNDMLAATIQTVILELFVRSQNKEVAHENWETIKNLIDGTFFNPHGSDHPEIVEALEQERARFAQAVEAREFADETQQGLHQLFEQHGVHETKGDSDDNWPGQYL